MESDTMNLAETEELRDVLFGIVRERIADETEEPETFRVEGDALRRYAIGGCRVDAETGRFMAAVRNMETGREWNLALDPRSFEIEDARREEVAATS